MLKSTAIVLIFLSTFYYKAASTSCRPPVVGCYFTSWAWYRSGNGKYLPSDIDSNLCTHIFYAFANLDPVELKLVTKDNLTDYNNNFYKQITSLKSKGKTVLLSIGGGLDSKGEKYSRLVSDVNARQNFIQQSKQFVQQNGFQGLDIDWEFPVCWKSDCSLGPASDKKNFADFIVEMKSAYASDGLLMTAAVSSSTFMSDRAYDIPVLSQNLDLIGVMTYDYYSKGVTGANSPQLGSPSAFHTMDFYVQKGADPCKLLVGIPLYANTFTLTNTDSTYFGAPVTGPGNPGSITRTPGYLTYYEVCSQIKSSGWTVVHTYANSSYTYFGNQWASYCSPEDIMTRANLILSKPYRGAMIWSLDSDDFNNTCGCGRYPLLTTLNVGLGRIPGSQASCS